MNTHKCRYTYVYLVYVPCKKSATRIPFFPPTTGKYLKGSYSEVYVRHIDIYFDN